MLTTNFPTYSNQSSTSLAFEEHNTNWLKAFSLANPLSRELIEPPSGASILCINTYWRGELDSTVCSVHSVKNDSHDFAKVFEFSNATVDRVAKRRSLLVLREEVKELTNFPSDLENRHLLLKLVNAALFSQSSSIKPLYSRPLESELDKLIEESIFEQFEVGMESKFAQSLSQLFNVNPVEILSSLKERVHKTKCNSNIVAEIMRWAGELEINHDRDCVVALLCTGLQHNSSLVRDAAALSLGNFEGTSAIGYLESAIERETIPELREDMRDLVTSLQR